MLSAHDVRFRYRPHLPWVLDGLSFAVVPGEVVGLLRYRQEHPRPAAGRLPHPTSGRGRHRWRRTGRGHRPAEPGSTGAATPRAGDGPALGGTRDPGREGAPPDTIAGLDLSWSPRPGWTGTRCDQRRRAAAGKSGPGPTHRAPLPDRRRDQRQPGPNHPGPDLAPATGPGSGCGDRRAGHRPRPAVAGEPTDEPAASSQQPCCRRPRAGQPTKNERPHPPRHPDRHLVAGPSRKPSTQLSRGARRTPGNRGHRPTPTGAIMSHR
jgi:hypothetical protein